MSKCEWTAVCFHWFLARNTNTAIGGTGWLRQQYWICPSLSGTAHAKTGFRRHFPHLGKTDPSLYPYSLQQVWQRQCSLSRFRSGADTGAEWRGTCLVDESVYHPDGGKVFVACHNLFAGRIQRNLHFSRLFGKWQEKCIFEALSSLFCFVCAQPFMEQWRERSLINSLLSSEIFNDDLSVALQWKSERWCCRPAQDG